MIQSRLLLQGIKEGTATVTVRHKSNDGVIPVALTVYIEPVEITIGRPYTITGPNFVGMYVGQEREPLRVSMDNATEVEKGRVQWESKNNAAVRVTGNGLEAFASAFEVGQSNVVASHDRAQPDGKTIVVYVVATEKDLENAVVLGIEKQHWLLKPGEEVLMSLITNADPQDAEFGLAAITWGGNDPDIVKVDYNGDKALVTAMGEGSTVVKVSHPRKVIDLNIYISVSTKESFDKSVTVPSIVEMIVDENKVVQAACVGLSANEKKAITWTIDDPMVADISSDGDILYLRGRSRNQAWITVNVPSIGYTKKILLLCKASYDDVMYVFSANETYYKLKAGEQKRVDLIFGSAGFPEDERGNIEWTDVENNKVVKIPVAAGSSASVIAENEGIAKVRVNHKNNLNVKPLELSFEVYKDSDSPEDYRFVYNSILGLVMDPNDELHSQLVTVGITPQGMGYSQINWKDEKAGENEYVPVMDVKQTGMGNEFVVTATALGQTYLRIEREQVYDPARILVYTAENREALEALYPLALSKQNYLLTVNQVLDIEVKTIDDNPGKITNISWAFDTGILLDGSYPLKLENNDSDKRVRRFTARNPGNCVVEIKYNGVTVEKAYVSVKSAGGIDQSKKIMTENIIGMKPRTAHTTSLVLSSNITDEEIGSLIWDSDDKTIVTVAPVPGNNKAAVLTAVWNGAGERETEVTVSLGQIKRHIKVYVSGNIEGYKAVNLDNRYYQLRMGDNFTLSAFHHYLDTKTDDQWRFVPENNNVVKIDRLNPNVHNKIQITGLNEGVTTIELSNPSSSPTCTPVLFHIEVSKSAPIIIDNTDDWYLTAIKTVYAVDPAKVFDLSRLSVIAVKFPPEEAAKIKWEIIKEYNEEGVLVNYVPEGGSRLIKTPELIEILGNQAGEFIDIRPNNKKGKAVLRVSHAKSANDLQITVWCDVGMIPAVTTPFIEVNEEIVKLQINTEKQVTLSVANMYDFDIQGFWIRDANGNPVKEYSDNIIEAKLVANVLMVKGNVFGQTMLTISHDDVPLMQKRILTLVLSGDSDIVYLTTTQNFNVVQKTEYLTINVDLVGYDDLDNRNFEWINDSPELISINYSGKTAVVRGLDIGTARIMVFHRYCQYVLNLYVRVTEQTWENPVYVTTPNNIISIKRNESMQVKAVLVNGLPQEMTQFQWGTNDRHLIDLQSSGDTAHITGKGVGTAMVSIGHPSSLNVVTMLVIVEEIPENLAVYIVSSDSLLVEMGTNETQRRITAHLTGASPQDDFGLQWAVTNYSSLVKQPDGSSYQVVTIIANGDTCYIQPYRVTGYGIIEGEAIITVKHPKTSHRLDFKVIVMDSTDIRFQESYITMNQGETKTVSVKTPANRVIRYSTSDKGVVEVDGTSTMCILKAKGEGVAIISAYDVGGTKSDEIIVRVNELVYDRPYINTSTFVQLSMQMAGGVALGAWLKNARDDANLPYDLNENLYWTVDNAGRVDLYGGSKNKNYPEPFNDYNFGSSVGISAKSVGDAVITVKYYVPSYYGPNDPRNHDSYKEFPGLADVEIKIYVRVNSSGTSVVIDPVMFNLEWGDKEGKIVTARVVGASAIDYDTDIIWETDNKYIARVEKLPGTKNESRARVYTSSSLDEETSESGPVIIRAIFERKGERIDYGAATAVVSPKRLLWFSVGSLDITPGDVRTFTTDGKDYKITCYPEDEQLIASASSNAYFSFEYREEFKDGKANRKLTITGTSVEGSGSVILTGKTNGLTAQLLVNNALNQNIHWQNGKTVYLKPKDSTTKLYMLTPERYSLRFNGQNGNNHIAVKNKGDKEPMDSAGNRYPNAELVFEEIEENTGHPDFKKGYRVKSHETYGKSGYYNPIFTIMDGEKDSGMGDVALEVYVGYENVAIDISAVSINNNGGNKVSVFDKTQSSIRLAGNQGNNYDTSGWLNGLEFTITAKSGSFTDDNIYDVNATFGDDEKDTHLGKDPNGPSNKIKLYYVTMTQEPNTGPSGTLYKSDFVGVLTITYRYNTYTQSGVPGTKNFLVYHDRYYR
jgi:hypothetical protein